MTVTSPWGARQTRVGAMAMATPWPRKCAAKAGMPLTGRRSAAMPWWGGPEGVLTSSPAAPRIATSSIDPAMAPPG